jgi:uncharacterized protein YkwD
MITNVTLCALMALLGAPKSDESNPAETAPPKAAAKADAKQPQPAAKTDKSSEKTKPKTDVKSAEESEAKEAKKEPEVKVVDGVRLAAIEANVVSYTNEQRVQHGLPPLEVDKELMETAREHAAWMTRMRSMVHTRRPVAENIAMGQPHSSDVVRSWMNSPGHRANILNSGYRRIGVAAYRTEGGTIYWCQQFQP